jgi:hypothetical protein
VNIVPQSYYYRLFMLNTFHLKHCINEVASRLRISGRNLVGKRRNYSCRFQRSLGFLATKTLSSRLVFTLWGACRRRSGFTFASSAIVIMGWMNRSSPSLLSDSVGSIIRATLTTSGKYIVGRWKP